MPDIVLPIAAQPLTTPIKLFMVEDSASDRYTYIRYLRAEKSLDYHIVEAETLEEGLSLWQSFQSGIYSSQLLQIALVDINLPDGNGLELLEMIRGNHPQLPVIVITGQGDERMAVRAMKLGASDYLVKEDITASVLGRCVANVIRQFKLSQELERLQRQEQISSRIALQIRQFLKLEEIYQAIVTEVRGFLTADRVMVYKFLPDMSGVIVAEDVVSPWLSFLNTEVIDNCFQQNLGGAYQQGRIFVAADIHRANLTDCHLQLLERFQVKANLVVPILLPASPDQQSLLWGLLIAHQCSAPRIWDEVDIELLQRLSVKLAIALQQAELYQNLQDLNTSLEKRVTERTSQLQNLIYHYQQAEKKLQFQSHILDEINDAVISTDLQGNIQTWNKGAERFFGYRAEEVIGQNVDILYENVSELHTKVLEPLLANGYHEVELINVTKSGERRYTSLRLSITRDQQGNIMGLLGCSNDITDRKRDELKLQETNEQLAQATRLKDEFLANMSHELRTPLNAILGMSESLQESIFGEINPQQQEAIALIESSGKHLLDLINDILDLSKIEAGKLELKRESIAVQSLCKSSTLLVQQMAFSKNIQLHTRIASHIDRIWGDERYLRQVLVNLLSNAIKFTPSGGNVTLAVQQEPTEILFSVRDTGIGIQESDLGKLFQLFVQIDSSLSRQYTGTGLGLALVKRLVTQHGGTISVESTLGQGSCFTIHLPIQSSETLASPIAASSPLENVLSVSTSTPPPLILLADNNESTTKTLEDYFTIKGYRILLAYSGQETLALAKSHKPDLILMDLQMPDLEESKVITQIRSDVAIAAIPIIAVTDLALPEAAEKCSIVGINEYVSKPVRLKRLAEIVRQFCHQDEESR
jgi:PAS domain S-box-containing protein